MPAVVTATPLADLLVLRPARHHDPRGDLIEVYHRRDFAALGLSCELVQENQSRSRAGVLRGLHFQRRRPQAKLVRAVTGRVFDVAVDLRTGSPSFGRWHGEILDPRTASAIYLPPGFAHGFLALEDAVVVYQCSEYHDPDDQHGVRWCDPDLAIAWPLERIGEPILSPRDRALPWLSEIDPVTPR